eukprot:TRINITY_DN48318_c0_g1_i1.p1 TRINITY_DN48318_c0_g1~~TRINITY_DN48318_c0_g1_i1.p1  ORF type:complete len:286 (-),score=45.15 TRINITY_DN48318_c0_g1_i1:22-819(-)
MARSKLWTFVEGRDFGVVSREMGAVSDDIPVFAMAPNSVLLEQPSERGPGSACSSEVAGVPGAFLQRNVLTPEECEQLMRLTEAAGYGSDAPTRLGRHIRKNDNCVIVADEATNSTIFERCRRSFPSAVHGGEVCGINRRWRFYRYGPGDIFRAHIDPDGWTGSGFDSGGRLLDDAYGDRTSRMTLLIYLNDAFEGGGTRFFVNPTRPRLGCAEPCHHIVRVSPEQGSALCFFHGRHEQSPWHEGEELGAGVKYVLRTDVLFKLP